MVFPSLTDTFGNVITEANATGTPVAVLKRIKRKDNLKKIPIIMLTAKGQEDDKIRGFELGVEDYVTKPFLPSEILARIKSLLKRTMTLILNIAAITIVKKYREKYE